MKNFTLAKLAVAGVVLVSSLSAASAQSRHQTQSQNNDDQSVAAERNIIGYDYGIGALTNPNTDNQFIDNELRRRDIENQGG